MASSGPQIEISTSRGGKYVITPKLMTVLEIRVVQEQMRTYESEKVRLASRFESTVRIARRETEAAGRRDIDEYEEAMERVDRATEMVERARLELHEHATSLYPLEFYVDSIAGYETLTDIPAWDSREILEIVTDWVDGGDLAGHKSGEAPSAKWQLLGSPAATSTPKH